MHTYSIFFDARKVGASSFSFVAVRALLLLRVRVVKLRQASNGVDRPLRRRPHPQEKDASS